jgi:alkanesulfonate monooxygenase SsuD/methylene tetrahydromethanopterin reductase-like flavin-dependent oxidoreductase (luciferase family)
VTTVGLALWTMQSTAAAPAAPAALYAGLQRDARLAEELGFHSLWVAEHHFWYDGWCPSPLTAAAAALAATERLHVGTGIHILPLHDPDRSARAAERLHAVSGGRFELGVGLGYRDPEYDGFGLERRARGRRMAGALTAMAERWADGGPRVWVGGVSPTALGRAARRGMGMLLPQTLPNARVTALLEELRAIADGAGRPLGPLAVIRHAAVTDGSPREAAAARAAIAAASREYQGAWWRLKGQPAFDVPDLLERQLERATETALVGTAAEVAGQIDALASAGADVVVLQVEPLADAGAQHARLSGLAAALPTAAGARG